MALIEFDSRNYLGRERMDAMRDTCAALANMAPDIDGDEGSLSLSMRIRLLPGVAVAAVNSSPMRVHRSTRQLADGNDDVLLFLNPGDFRQERGDGAWVVRQRGLGQRGELASASGPGCVALNERAGGIDFHAPRSACLLIAFPRERLLPQVAAVDRVLREGLTDSLPLRLLTQQALELTRLADLRDPGDAERQRLSDQLLDLGALALGATPQARAQANAHGLRQARLKAIKADVRVHAWRGDLSLEWVAARHGISARYVRALFEQDDSAFSDYLLEQRLQRAWLRLRDPRHAGSTVSDIAYGAGFNNLSWFYRAFTRRFGSAPGDARQQPVQGASAVGR